MPLNLAVLVFFLIWYVINVKYNEWNKQALNVLKLPWTLSALQLGLALVLYVAPLWLTGVRKMPKISMDNAKAIFPIAVIHGLGQCVTVLSLGAGSLAFVNVVKSLEPLFNVVFGAIFMNDILPWQVCSALPGATRTVDGLCARECARSFTTPRRISTLRVCECTLQVNACLLPVVGGVGLASAADLSFTWDCFAFAMGSNLAFSLRGVLSKKAMGKPQVGSAAQCALPSYPTYIGPRP